MTREIPKNGKGNKNVKKEIGNDSNTDSIEEWMKLNSNICGLI